MARAVSLVPSATETVIALGARDCLVGISDDCLAVKGAEGLAVVSHALVGGSSETAQIDAEVRELLGSGRPLYELDQAVLCNLAPDVIFAQDECAVCAVPAADVLQALGPRHAAVCSTVSIDPHDLEDVLASFELIAGALGLSGRGDELAASCRERLDKARTGPGDNRVLVLDWPEPAFVAGNWVPELVTAAGGTPVGAGRREPSRQIDLGTLGGEVDSVVVAPCGLSLAESAAAAERLAGAWPELGKARWCALDGRAWFSRPGPGLVDGAVALAAWLDGGTLPPSVGTEVTR